MKILTLLLLFFVTYAILSAGNTTTISGTVLGYDSKPLKLAQIQVLRIGTTNRKTTAYNVNTDGTFSVSLPNGWYNIQFTGVNHQITPKFPQRIYCCGETIKITTQLEANLVPLSIDSVHIVTDITDYNFDDAVPMVKHKDGTFSVEIKTKKKEVGYQVILFGGVVNQDTPPHSINGTTGYRFEYDNGGDYRSFVNVKNDIAKIVFDSKQLPSTKGNSSCLLNDDLSKAIKELSEQEQKDNQVYYAAYYQHKQGKPTDYNPTAIRQKIRELINKTTNVNLRECYMLSYLKVNFLSKDSTGADPAFVSEIFATIPPTSLVWENSPTTVNTAIKLCSDSNNNYPDRVLKESSSSLLKAEILLSKIQKASTQKDNKQLKMYYTQLLSDYPNTFSAKRAEKEFNPDKAIVVGKQIPNFSFMGIEENTGTNITPASLKGKWVLIDNWATWCGPCVGEMAELHKTFEKFKNKNFTILSVSYDKSAKDVTKFRNSKWKMPWMHCFSEGVWDNEAAKIFEVTGIPKPILIDPTGKIVVLENELRGQGLEQTIEKFVQ